MKKIKVGIIGAGRIVPSFLESARESGLEAVAIWNHSSGRIRAKKLAQEFQIPRVYDTYEGLLADATIHTVYIALPNSLHGAFGKDALLAGKHVLMERPFTASLKEARELRALASEHGRFLFEAVPHQFTDIYAKLKKTLPAIGRIKLVHLNIAQYSQRYEDFQKGEAPPAFSQTLAGGSLMDLGSSSLQFLVGLFGMPGSIRYQANIEGQIDTSGVLTLVFPGFICAASAAQDSLGQSGFAIQGTQGMICSSESPANFRSFHWTDALGTERVETSKQIEGALSAELKSYRTMVETSDWGSMEKRLDQSLLVMELLDEARRQAGLTIPGEPG